MVSDPQMSRRLGVDAPTWLGPALDAQRAQAGSLLLERITPPPSPPSAALLGNLRGVEPWLCIQHAEHNSCFLRTTSQLFFLENNLKDWQKDDTLLRNLQSQCNGGWAQGERVHLVVVEVSTCDLNSNASHIT